jgi:hypothetical protein
MAGSGSRSGARRSQYSIARWIISLGVSRRRRGGAGSQSSSGRSAIVRFTSQRDPTLHRCRFDVAISRIDCPGNRQTSYSRPASSGLDVSSRHSNAVPPARASEWRTESRVATHDAESGSDQEWKPETAPNQRRTDTINPSVLGARRSVGKLPQLRLPNRTASTHGPAARGVQPRTPSRCMCRMVPT